MFNLLFRSKKLSRTPEQQKLADLKASKLALYHATACPFCLGVKSKIKKLNVNIEHKNVAKDQQAYNALIKEGGKRTVPCLRIESNQKTIWLYESSDIIAYLDTEFLVV